VTTPTTGKDIELVGDNANKRERKNGDTNNNNNNKWQKGQDTTTPIYESVIKSLKFAKRKITLSQASITGTVFTFTIIEPGRMPMERSLTNIIAEQQLQNCHSS